ncbi:hypothetical protein [Mesorhizobium sp. M1348]|uniref:hypothetical protein n=1 Tax=unclassified Mesorhizobium TaxID=325217 RepID=UPI00333B7998
MQEWTTDTLWAKAGVYGRQAMESDRKSPLFPLLASFALELLGKAALSQIHPVLIADPRSEGEAILYAFGVPTSDPKTIMSNTVFKRLGKLVPGFTEEDVRTCLILAEQRNRELHTGEDAFQDFKSGKWVPDFYRVTKILTEFMGRDLDELLGKEHAKDANEVTAEQSAKVRKEVLDRIQACKKSIAGLRIEELSDRRKADESGVTWARYTNGTAVKATGCPACESQGLLHLRHIADRPAEIVENTIFVDGIWSPRKFSCKVCGLDLDGTKELGFADLADQVVETDDSDPADFFGIEVGTLDEPDYGNE